MTKTEEHIYLQELEGKYWLELRQAHYNFMMRNGTFDTFELYDKALQEDKVHFYCLIKWSEISHLLDKFGIEVDKASHRKALEITRNEPKLYNF